MQSRDSHRLRSGKVLSRSRMQMQTLLLHFDNKQTPSLRKGLYAKMRQRFIGQHDHAVKIEAFY